MRRILSVFLAIVTGLVFAGNSAPGAVPSFKKVMIVIFENIDYKAALGQPTFAKFAREGALLTNFYAEVHPSQGDYIALTAGDNYGVTTDGNVNLDVKHIGDLIEAKGKRWEIYLEQYPGGCFTGKSSGTYVRKHNPFISFKDIQNDTARCSAHLIEASALATDIQNGTLPEFSLYIPDLNNDAHDTGVAYADRWFSKFFGPLMNDQHFMQDLLLVVSFDESGIFGGNHIYTAFYGDSVIAGSTGDARYDHYNLLRTIEDTLGLGTLGKKDAAASAIAGIWK